MFLRSLIAERLNLLIVGGEADDVLILTEALASTGSLSMTWARDEFEALDLLQSQEARGRRSPFVVLLCHDMPKMSGSQFLAKIRRDPVLRKLVVFMLGSSQDEDAVNEAYDHNVAGYLIKPRTSDGYVRLANLLNAYGQIVEPA